MLVVNVRRVPALVALMTNASDVSIPQYAVIEARGMEGPSQRLVIAYSDEKALRDLIAGPSIIGYGFSTREQAQGHADMWRPLEAEQPQGRRRTSPRDLDRQVLSVEQRLRVAFGLMEAGRIVRGLLKAASAAAILTFYSGHSFLAAHGYWMRDLKSIRPKGITAR